MEFQSNQRQFWRLVDAYGAARQHVIAAGYLAEIAWQQSRDIEAVTETEFLTQFAWVVLAAGFRDAVVRQKFPGILSAFKDFSSARAIMHQELECRKAALAAFGNRRKIDSILVAAQRVAKDGFDVIKARLTNGDVPYLQTFPFMGPATSYHLAKNLGMDVVKPDRHLLRITHATGYDSPERMCRDIGTFVGERLSVVDLVLWRYATLNPTYLEDFGIVATNSRTTRLSPPSRGFALSARIWNCPRIVHEELTHLRNRGTQY